MPPLSPTLLTVFSGDERILITLLPARPSRLNAISTPSARRNVCARRKWPARARGFFWPTSAVPRDTITAAFNAGPQKIGATRPGATLAHELPQQAAIGSASIMPSIAVLWLAA